MDISKIAVFIICMVILFTAVLIDQITKRIAVLKLNGSGRLLIRRGVFRLLIVRNTGAAFGILRGKKLLLKVTTVVLMVILTGYLVASIAYSEPIIVHVSLSLILGGALGNLVDRLRYGYVIDFVTVNIRRFPVFNMADVFILLGSLILLCMKA